MKVLIWILCFFANALITTLYKESGITCGAIPTMILFWRSDMAGKSIMYEVGRA